MLKVHPEDARYRAFTQGKYTYAKKKMEVKEGECVYLRGRIFGSLRYMEEKVNE